MFYIGSCRYMRNFNWLYFPARLHSTREIIYFLENINNVKKVISNNPTDLTNKIFGDIYHSSVIKDSTAFFEKQYRHNINKLILEICTRNVCYYKDVPLNNYYVQQNSSLINKYNLKLVELSDAEIEIDLKHIIQLSRRIFNNDTEIHVIPHLNLKTTSTNDYIHKRNDFVILLESLCKRLNIQIHNIGKYIEETIKSETVPYLEKYMNDSTHYSHGYNYVKKFLENKIY
jgi:hypothetical protein